ncbi:MAG: pentapeptide repeat-containing protein, partial [Flammeovirgaceae bacterium]
TALGKMYTQDELFGDEGLVLADTYIAPHFYIRERCFAKECSEKIEGKGRLLFEHNAHEFMYAFLRNQDVSSFRPTFKGKVLEECQFDADVINSNFLLLLGMPGQGKSSFCKRFLYDVLEENTVFEQELFFVRLLDMDVKGLMNDLWPNLTKEINKQAKEIVKLQLGITERFNFSEEDIREGILLLDGLDELEMSTNIRNEHAIELCKKIYNETKGELKAVITSRYSRVTEPDLYNYDFIWMEVAELSVNKQKEWFSKYKKHVPQAKLDVVQLWNYDDDYSDLKELLTQPLLLYIIAQLFNEEYIKVIHNSADLYDKLFTSVIDRGYDKKEKGFDNVFIELEKNLKLKEGGIKIMLRKILQEVAFLILINDKEYIGEQQLANATDMDNLNKLISKKDKNELKKIFRLIMMSFYMRNTLKNKDDQHKGDIVQTYGIEFIHKSFREYLTAEYIWRKLQLFREGEKRQERKIYNINKTDEALELIAHLFQYVKFEKDLINHVDNLVLRDTFEVREELLSRFNYFFSELIKRDFLFKLVQGRNPLNLIKTTFYNFWHIYMIIGKDRDNDNAYSNLINFPDNTPSKSHFYSLIRLSEHTLLYNQNLKGSDLANVNLGHFTFNGGDLGDANLIRADLSRSSLRKVNLHKSILKYANLSDSDLWNSNLKEADLSEANLRWVNLINSNLLGAILTNADLTDAELSFVNLRKANLTNTNLTRTNLSNAKLTQSQYDYLKASGQLDQALNVDKIIIVEEGEE